MGNRQDISADKSRPFRYAAFISYAHADETAAARLHNMLEAYRPPRPHQGKVDLLRPIFRDKAELTASHSLSDEIKAAVEGSRKLLVLCSPAAKVSHWVNEEIKLFRSLHGEDAILCALVEGTPDTSFPPALLEDGREPLAADLSGGREGFRYGVLQIAASLLGIGLDDLVRRDLRRRRRIGTSVVAGALIFSGAMGASTLSAMKARAAADANRAEAENLVEYMITDLKTKLEPVGRLDILDGVGDKVMDYYAGQNLFDMPDDRIARQARAQHLLGQVALDAGRYDEAKTQIDAAYALTKEVLKRNPDDTDAIFAHAQSAFWVGKVFRDQNRMGEIRPHWQEYRDLAVQLYDRDNSNLDWIMEAAWGESNLGLVERFDKNLTLANDHYLRAIELFDEALELKPTSYTILAEKADAIVGAEQIALSLGDYQAGLNLKRQSLSIFEKLLMASPQNMILRADVAEKKSDLLWQYSTLLTDEEQLELIEEPLMELSMLTRHDPSNKSWRRDYIWHLYYALSFSESEDLNNKVFLALEEFSSLQSLSNLTAGQKFVLDTLMARYNWAIGKREYAKNLLQRQSARFEQENNVSPTYAFFLAEIHSDFGSRLEAKKFAQLYLQNLSPNDDVRRIDAILRKASAEYIAGDCESALLTIVPIIRATDNLKLEIKGIKYCQT